MTLTFGILSITTSFLLGVLLGIVVTLYYHLQQKQKLETLLAEGCFDNELLTHLAWNLFFSFPHKVFEVKTSPQFNSKVYRVFKQKNDIVFKEKE
jgi:hypothetical protein